jgi:extradiol dioxygenase family protein
MHPFHLALPVHDLKAARSFYGEQLGCVEGRSAERWIDYDFFGHQLSVHLVDSSEEVATNSVDGDAVPARHFGVVLPWTEWEALQHRFGTYLIGPKIRFQGEVGEQGTFFVLDPSGNALEFKSFKDISRLFSS